MCSKNVLSVGFLLFLRITVCAQLPGAVQKTILFDEERKQLSIQYLKTRHGLEQSDPTIIPRVIVLHWTAIPSVEATFNTFNRSALPASRKAISSASQLNVSSQYLVDRDGTVYQLMPETMFARHVIGLNYCAIGVENIGSDKMPLTDAQLLANERIVRYLAGKYPIEYLIGHYEYQKFRGHSLWREADDSYLTIKTDPGESFMKKIRERLSDLNLKAAPDSRP
ncbi:N-acetylmuramoyl-L-alanine amidase [Arcticibacter sp. MXS-1]|uniref:N-acetylmuramoyl-L-alanine amidase n=1 Tax=Arcticibacter sp. MXS-1 TaxID=3341726 RepID=UPI0035A968E8